MARRKNTRSSWGSTGRKKRQTKAGVSYYYRPHYPFPSEYSEQFPGHKASAYGPSYDSEDAARVWLIDERRMIELGTWTPPEQRRAERRVKTLTFEEYAEKWLEERRTKDNEPLASTTKGKYLEYLTNHIYPMLGKRNLDSITNEDVGKWLDSMRDKGGRVKEGSHSLLKSIFHTACTKPLSNGDPLLKKDPTAGYKVVKADVKHKYVIATTKQLEKAVAAMPGHFRLAIVLAGVLGLREGEVLGLQRGDIDLKRSQLHVRRAVKDVQVEDSDGRKHRRTEVGTTKTKASVRVVDIPKQFVQPIRDHLDKFAGEGENGKLFPARRSDGWTATQTLRNDWIEARKTVPGLESMRFHDWRHTACTMQAAAGATGGELMAFAGHVDLSTVSKYQQIAEEHKKIVDSNLNDYYRRVTVTIDDATESEKATEMGREYDSTTIVYVSDEETRALADAILKAPESVRETLLAGLEEPKRIAARKLIKDREQGKKKA